MQCVQCIILFIYDSNAIWQDRTRDDHFMKEKRKIMEQMESKIKCNKYGVVYSCRQYMEHGSWMMCEVAKIMCVEYRQWPNIDETTATARKMKMNWLRDFVHSILFLLPLKWRKNIVGTYESIGRTKPIIITVIYLNSIL